MPSQTPIHLRKGGKAQCKNKGGKGFIPPPPTHNFACSLLSSSPKTSNRSRDWIVLTQFFRKCQLQQSTALCLLKHLLTATFRRKNHHSLLRKSMSLQTTTLSLTENLKEGLTLTPNRLANHKLRESHRLTLLSMLVQANVEGFARCHAGWQSQSLKVCTTWHINPPWAKLIKTSSTMPTLTYKSI